MLELTLQKNQKFQDIYDFVILYFKPEVLTKNFWFGLLVRYLLLKPIRVRTPLLESVYHEDVRIWLENYLEKIKQYIDPDELLEILSNEYGRENSSVTIEQFIEANENRLDFVSPGFKKILFKTLYCRFEMVTRDEYFLMTETLSNLNLEVNENNLNFLRHFADKLKAL